MNFPSLGSIIAKETGSAPQSAANALLPRWEGDRQYEEYFRSAFLGADYDPMCIPDPSKRKNFRVADLSLPKSVSEKAVESRQEFLKVVDRRYRSPHVLEPNTPIWITSSCPGVAAADAAVRDAFGLSKEPEGAPVPAGAMEVAHCPLAAWWKLERTSSPPPVFTPIHGTRTAPTIKDTATAWHPRSTALFPFFSKIWRSGVCSIPRSSSPWESLAGPLNSIPLSAATTGQTAGLSPWAEEASAAVRWSEPVMSEASIR
jgi:hypothetical protein